MCEWSCPSVLRVTLKVSAGRSVEIGVVTVAGLHTSPAGGESEQ